MSPHSVACSHKDAKRSKRASSHGLPINCKPMGKPSRVSPQGKLIAHSPSVLTALVAVQAEPADAKVDATSTSCTAGAAKGVVGVMRKSTVSKRLEGLGGH